MCSKLEAESSGLSLKLVSKSGPLVIYDQNNLSASRKVILPLITDALSHLAETPKAEVEGTKSSYSCCCCL